jgi:hypothetical protein
MKINHSWNHQKTRRIDDLSTKGWRVLAANWGDSPDDSGFNDGDPSRDDADIHGAVKSCRRIDDAPTADHEVERPVRLQLHHP